MKRVLQLFSYVALLSVGAAVELRHNTTQSGSRQPALRLPPYAVKVDTVKHEKEAGGVYLPGSPLFEKQKYRAEISTEGEAVACAWMLVGAMIFVMVLFYLVNHKRCKDEGNGEFYWRPSQIQILTWKTLSMTVSIFSSVMIYVEVKDFSLGLIRTVYHFDERQEHIYTLAMFFVLYFAVNCLLWFFKEESNTMTLLAAGTICAHISGFAAMYGFAGLQEMEPFESSAPLSFAVVFIAIAVLLPLTVGTERFRMHIAFHDSVVDASEERWMEQTIETENDVIGLCIGFLMMQVFRHLITGKSQQFEASVPPEDISYHHASLLLACGIFSLVMCFMTNKIAASYMDKAGAEQHPHICRAFMVLKNAWAMCMAWCLLFWADWQIYAMGYQGSRMFGVILVALLSTTIALAFVFVMDAGSEHWHIQKGKGLRAIRSIELAMGMLVGFSWEKAFDVAVESIVESMSRDELQVLPGWLVQFTLVVGSQAIVLPAWYFYVLPKSKDAHYKDLDLTPRLSSGTDRFY